MMKPKFNKLFLLSQLSIMKNVTPSQLTLGISLLLGLITALMLTICYIIAPKLFIYPISTIFLLTLFNIVVSYALMFMAIEKFIYRKIKIIYKQIRRMKRPTKDVLNKIDMQSNMLEEVESEVKEWAKEHKQEIDQLKRMEAYRREFLGNVSHELKTPIYNVQGYLDTLIATKLADEKINMKYLKKANKNADRLAQIVGDLEDITKLEAGELELNKEAFKMYDLADEVMESMEIMAAKKNITLKFKDGSDKNVLVNADLELIQQVITNLITNSIKYGKENGTTWIGIYKMDKLVLIEVTDNGIGIEQNHLPRLFERFYRVDQSRTRKKGGSGLGLAIVKHIIEAHKQAVHVRSKEDIGTTFGFTLEQYTA